jgi:UDP-apiose/xylose synthase
MKSNSNLSICILGCAGFIGSHITERILSTTNWQIFGIDRNPAKISSFISHPNFTYANINIKSEQDIKEFIEKSDVVISLTALCNPSLYNTIPIKVIDSNYNKPLKIVKLCTRKKKWLIHFSTCEVYGTTISHRAGVPFNPETDVFNEEKTPFVYGPIHAQRWTYACAKQLLERYIYALGEEKGLQYTIIRPFNFIGPRMDFIPGIDGEGIPRVLACFMHSLLQKEPIKLVDKGNARRTFTYIQDAVDAIMSILNNSSKAKKQIFNIANPQNETTIADLANMMIKIYKELRPEYSDYDFKIINVSKEEFYGKGYEDCDRRVADISAAKSLLNWHPKVSLYDSLKLTMESYIREYVCVQLTKEKA